MKKLFVFPQILATYWEKAGQGLMIGIGRYPEELADRRWDNVGLLVDNSDADAEKRKPLVLVTNDLTYQVAVDAIKQGVSVIVSYRMYQHPGVPLMRIDVDYL